LLVSGTPEDSVGIGAESIAFSESLALAVVDVSETTATAIAGVVSAFSDFYSEGESALVGTAFLPL